MATKNQPTVVDQYAQSRSFAELARCRKVIEEALQYTGGTHTFEDVVAAVLGNRFQFWPGAESAVVTEVLVYPRMRELHYFLAGGNSRELDAMRPMIEAWGKSVNCTRVSLSGRKGWNKSFLIAAGYKPVLYTLAKELV